MAASPEKENIPSLQDIEKQLSMLGALNSMHQKAMLDYAGKHPKGLARKLNNLFLLSLKLEEERLNLLKKHEQEKHGRERENLEKEQQRERASLQKQHQKKLDIPPIRFDIAESQCLTGFKNGLLKKASSQHIYSWIPQITGYFKHLLLQPEIFNVDIQKQLEPIAELLRSLSSQISERKDKNNIAQRLKEFDAIKAMTTQESELNQKISKELEKNLKDFDKTVKAKYYLHLETQLNRLYDKCMRCLSADDGWAQRYMFVLLIQKLRQAYPQHKDTIECWITFKIRDLSVLASIPAAPAASAVSASKVEVITPVEGIKAKGDGDKSEGGKEREEEKEEEDDKTEEEDDETEEEVLEFSEIRRIHVQSSSPQSINRSERREGENDAAPEDEHGSPGAKKIDDALTLTRGEVLNAGLYIAFGSICVIGALILAVSSMVTVIPTFGTSLAMGMGVGGVLGIGGMGFVVTGLSMFGVFGDSAKRSALECHRMHEQVMAPFSKTV